MLEAGMMKEQRAPFPARMLIDQGVSDQFPEVQLKPALFQASCKQAKRRFILHRHPGYDRGYYLVSSLKEDHLPFFPWTLHG
jgi:S-formylglutathione hydrolase